MKDADEALRGSQAFFAERAEEYRKSRSHGDREELARMVAWLAPRPGARALDVATGGGHTALALREAGCEAVASDATLPMLRGLADAGLPLVAADAQRLPFRDGAFDVVASDGTPQMLHGLSGNGLPLVTADAQRLPFRGGAFGIVASRIAPHHFPDLPAFCREAARVLTPGGALYVFDLTSPADPEAARLVNHLERLRDPSHVWSHAPQAWRDALRQAGLQAERLEETASTFDLEPWIARARMPPAREAEARTLLRDHPAEALGGYGLTPDGRMRVLRVELLARRP